MAYLDSLLQRCSSLSLSHSHLKQLHSHLLTSGLFCLRPSAATKLIELCAISPSGGDHLSYAADLFRRIQTPSTNDWNAVLRGLAQCPQPIKAISWFKTMSRAAPPKADALTCSFALKACARALARSEATQIHSQVVRFGFGADMLLQTTLLDVYAKVGDIDCAQQLFDEMRKRDIASWNALIAGLAQGSRPNEAIALFKRMREEGGGLRPNEVTVLGALSACSQLGAFRVGEEIHGYIMEENLDMNVIVCNAVIDMYGKCGFVEKAYGVFSSMKCKKNIVTWNTMIMALALHGDACKALELFRQMREARVQPDAVSYLGALCGCNHAGLVDEGVRLFYSMAECGLVPNVKHYGSVVDLLGRAGRLQEAYEIVNSMPMLPDVVLWQTLLGASKTYGDVEMAEIASQKLMEMGSSSCGDFVLLSNVYAAHERWDDVGRVREAMKKKDVKKIPGFSYTEVEGVIHKFLNGDQSHEKWREIYTKLDEINFKLTSYGYVAKTNLVLHDIGEEDKENVLSYHSEKLAVAFGLISTGEGTPIQVIKNLRICEDCHVVIKLVSKIFNREIIVRDRARFHRFKDGLCSCKEYW
ncbi:DYW domain containing protein [Trema orientale]|uniref:DYW domain containing protein n=1 Tax=Trema orientale TaxID=63057 RepID=A0A2P5FR57_TREOI|nr:DYW domain containing protein [Trema orientale]